MERKNLATILSYFTYRQLEPGVEIFRKGEKGDDVIIILSGRVAVLDGNLNIATLSRGEILGEMSQLTSQAVSATVKTVEKTEVLSISGENFRKVLEENPSLYLYFLRLFSERLTKSNAARLQEVASAMSGTLDEMPQVELFQVFHMNNKTGVLTLELPKGKPPSPSGKVESSMPVMPGKKSGCDLRYHSREQGRSIQIHRRPFSPGYADRRNRRFYETADGWSAQG